MLVAARLSCKNKNCWIAARPINHGDSVPVERNSLRSGTLGSHLSYPSTMSKSRTGHQHDFDRHQSDLLPDKLFKVRPGILVTVSSIRRQLSGNISLCTAEMRVVLDAVMAAPLHGCFPLNSMFVNLWGLPRLHTTLSASIADRSVCRCGNSSR